MTTAGAAFVANVEENKLVLKAFNTKKDVEEYCKQFWKDYKEKAKEAKAAAKADKPKRKKGLDKDGNPKKERAPSAYNIFVKEKRPEIKEANPEMDNKEIFAEIGRIWKEQKAEKAPSEEEKKVSDKKEEEEKEEEENEEEENEEEIVEVVDAPKKKPGRKAIAKKAKKTSPEEAQEEASE